MAEGGTDCSSTRPAFGNRFLTDPDKVFEHNAWDSVEWEVEQEREAELKVQQNSSQVLPDDVREQYEVDAAKHWDAFYQQHQNRFFKDRHWLFTEFPELKGPPNGGKFSLLEVGCGVGNTVFPILQVNSNPDLFIYCCDFAESAIKIIKEHSLYDSRHVHAFQCDVTDPAPLPIPSRSLDLIVLVFVLSAIQPCYHGDVIKKLCGLLKPGGKLLFRDYGRYDLAQLRFKKGQCLSDQFYVRGDGTRVYFFTPEEVRALLCGGGLEEEEFHVDRRLQVNRGKQLKMYRIWIQAKYVKPHLTNRPSSGTSVEPHNNPSSGTSVEPHLTSNPSSGTSVEPHLTSNPSSGTSVELYLTSNPSSGISVEPHLTTNSISDFRSMESDSSSSNNLCTESH